MKSIAINFKPLTENDFLLLLGWFQKPHIERWYARGETYTLAMIREKYLPRILNPESIPNFIIYANDNPIGYIQLYSLQEFLPDGVEDHNHPLFADFNPKQMVGIDLFIAEEDYLHQGYATLALRNFINTWVKGKFDMLIADPLRTNENAIRFFERNGFKKLMSHPHQSMNEILVLHLSKE